MYLLSKATSLKTFFTQMLAYYKILRTFASLLKASQITVTRGRTSITNTNKSAMPISMYFTTFDRFVSSYILSSPFQNFCISVLNHIYKEENQKRRGKHYKCDCRCTFVVIFLQLRHNDKRSDFCFKRLVACNKNNRTVLTKTSSECKTKACENRGKNFGKNNFSENPESACTREPPEGSR